jgi:hypothetical protein
VLLTYSVPFDLPLYRRADVGAVQGRVYDAESGAGLRNIVLNLDGLTAVIDGRGEFEFPAVRAGNYQLSMDRGNVGVDKVPAGKLPLDVVVAAGDSQRVEVALANSVSVAVSVRLPEGYGHGWRCTERVRQFESRGTSLSSPHWRRWTRASCGAAARPMDRQPRYRHAADRLRAADSDTRPGNPGRWLEYSGVSAVADQARNQNVVAAEDWLSAAAEEVTRRLTVVHAHQAACAQRACADGPPRP